MFDTLSKSEIKRATLETTSSITLKTTTATKYAKNMNFVNIIKPQVFLHFAKFWLSLFAILTSLIPHKNIKNEKTAKAIDKVVEISAGIERPVKLKR